MKQTQFNPYVLIDRAADTLRNLQNVNLFDDDETRRALHETMRAIGTLALLRKGLSEMTN